MKNRLPTALFIKNRLVLTTAKSLYKKKMDLYIFEHLLPNQILNSGKYCLQLNWLMKSTQNWLVRRVPCLFADLPELGKAWLLFLLHLLHIPLNCHLFQFLPNSLNGNNPERCQVLGSWNHEPAAKMINGNASKWHICDSINLCTSI